MLTHQFSATHAGSSEPVDSPYRRDQAFYRRTLQKGSPAFNGINPVAKAFIDQYGLPARSISFAWMEHPKGTVIVDANDEVITVTTLNGKTKNLSPGRRCALYFKLPVPIPDLGLEQGAFVGFMGDVKVLNANIRTNCYFFCRPYNAKTWRLDGVVRKNGTVEMGVERVRNVVENAQALNSAKRSPHPGAQGTEGNGIDVGEVNVGEMDACEVDVGEMDACEVDVGEMDACEVDVDEVDVDETHLQESVTAGSQSPKGGDVSSPVPNIFSQESRGELCDHHPVEEDQVRQDSTDQTDGYVGMVSSVDYGFGFPFADSSLSGSSPTENPEDLQFDCGDLISRDTCPFDFKDSEKYLPTFESGPLF